MQAPSLSTPSFPVENLIFPVNGFLNGSDRWIRRLDVSGVSPPSTRPPPPTPSFPLERTYTSYPSRWSLPDGKIYEVSELTLTVVTYWIIVEYFGKLSLSTVPPYLSGEPTDRFRSMSRPPSSPAWFDSKRRGWAFEGRRSMVRSQPARAGHGRPADSASTELGRYP